MCVIQYSTAMREFEIDGYSVLWCSLGGVLSSVSGTCGSVEEGRGGG